MYNTSEYTARLNKYFESIYLLSNHKISINELRLFLPIVHNPVDKLKVVYSLYFYITKYVFEYYSNIKKNLASTVPNTNRKSFAKS